MREPRLWLRALLAIALLAVLAWQGRHVAHLVPRAEAAVADLGIWGPVVFVASVVLLSPLLFPDSLFGVVAGFVFGLGPGTAYYFAAVYVANLVVFALGRSWLRDPTMRVAGRHPKANAILRSASRDSLKLAFLIRLVPVNVAFVSYLFGAGRFSWKSILIGNFACLPHLFLAVYIGEAARHATTLSSRTGTTAYLEDAAMLLGLLAAACVVAVVTRMASRAVAELEGTGFEAPGLATERGTQQS